MKKAVWNGGSRDGRVGASPYGSRAAGIRAEEQGVSVRYGVYAIWGRKGRVGKGELNEGEGGLYIVLAGINFLAVKM